jgi:dUTP pyrophosphatase
VTESIEVLFTGALPVYAHPGDAGADLVSTEDVVLAPGERATVPTGLSIALPNGYVGFVVPRSGLAMRHGITIVNSPGTVDAGYRGEIRITLLNTDARESYAISAGDRVAQLIVMALPRVRFVEVERLPGSERGEGGFGSTGYRQGPTGPQQKASS